MLSFLGIPALLYHVFLGTSWHGDGIALARHGTHGMARHGMAWHGGMAWHDQSDVA